MFLIFQIPLGPYFMSQINLIDHIFLCFIVYYINFLLDFQSISSLLNLFLPPFQQNLRYKCVHFLVICWTPKVPNPKSGGVPHPHNNHLDKLLHVTMSIFVDTSNFISSSPKVYNFNWIKKVIIFCNVWRLLFTC